MKQELNSIENKYLKAVCKKIDIKRPDDVYYWTNPDNILKVINKTKIT